MSGSRYPSPLAPYVATMRDPDPEGARKAARELWHKFGIAVVHPDDCHGLDRQFIEAIANRVHGKRR